MLPLFKINQKGFTLIEVILALVLFSVLATSILELFSVSMKRVQELNSKVTALYLAQEIMEQIIADRRTQGYAYLVPAHYSESQIPQAKGYRCTVSIEPQGLKLKKITVTVSWKNGKENLVSYLGDY